MMSEELHFSLESSHVLSMDLEGKGPESSLPNQTSLSVLESRDILILDRTRTVGHCEIEVSNIEPESHDSDGSDDRPDLEPTL